MCPLLNIIPPKKERLVVQKEENVASNIQPEEKPNTGGFSIGEMIINYLPLNI